MLRWTVTFVNFSNNRPRFLEIRDGMQQELSSIAKIHFFIYLKILFEISLYLREEDQKILK